MPVPAPYAHPFPDHDLHLEEAGAAAPADTAAALGFALWRAAAGREEHRPVALVAPRGWLKERGRLFGQGMSGLGVPTHRLLLIVVDREAQALWALEETLKSAAVAGAVGAVAAPPFVATRRLDFAAKAGRAACVLLRATGGGDLSAARLRWKIATAPSAPHPFDARAPGAARLTAELVRRRGGPAGGSWIMEQDDETGRFRLAAGLADHGLVAGQDEQHAA